MLTCFKFLVPLIIQGGGQRDGGQSFMGVVLICLDVSFAVGSLILLLTMLFLVHAPISQRFLFYFACNNVGGRYFLRQDYTIECFKNAHWEFSIVVISFSIQILSSSIVQNFIPARKSTSRKGDNGIVIVVGGSYIYHGAPVLSSLAALRCGTDLVYTSVPKINVTPTRAISPNLIVIPLVDQKLTLGAVKKLVGALPRNLHSATIGMGLAIQEKNSLLYLVKSLLDRDVRLSLDASALIPEVLPLLANKNVVVTPHSGEFKRLFGDVPPDSQNERIPLVEQHALDNGITILLKGPTDIISNGKTTYLCEKNTPAMTVGGTGDVLSGLVAGLLSKNRNSLESAAAASFICGLAGKHVQDKLGLHMTSMDLIDAIPNVMKPFDKII